MRKNKLFLYALSTVVIGANAMAAGPDDSAERFQDVLKRNVFRLRPPAAPVEPEPPKPPLPKLVLDGITTILGPKLALLKAQPPAGPGKLANPTNEISMILAEGQREQNVEVLQIDEKAGVVKVNNSGTVETLTFEGNGPKPPSAGPGHPPMAPGVAMAGAPAPQPLLPGNWRPTASQ